MRIAFDIGGVLSKYPAQFRRLIDTLGASPECELFCITDMHDRQYVLDQLDDNEIRIPHANVYCADYQTHGEFCKAVLLQQLKIDLFFDDFGAYTCWDSQFGSAPVRLLVQPDPFRPYWADDWKTRDNHDFGRRRFKKTSGNEDALLKE